MKASEAVFIAEGIQLREKNEALSKIGQIYDLIKKAAGEGKRSIMYTKEMHSAVMTELIKNGYNVITVKENMHNSILQSTSLKITW